jgi:hypothetical protein
VSNLKQNQSVDLTGKALMKIIDDTEIPMSQKLNPSELTSFKELLISTMIETQTLAQLLMKKGIIGQQKYFTELKQVQAEYESRKADG